MFIIHLIILYAICALTFQYLICWFLNTFLTNAAGSQLFNVNGDSHSKAIVASILFFHDISNSNQYSTGSLLFKSSGPVFVLIFTF
jgi:hypothetical protein